MVNESSSEQPARRCPFCDENIQLNARKCRYCGEFLDSTMRSTPYSGNRGYQAQSNVGPQTYVTITRTWNPGLAAILSFLIPGVGQMYKGEVGRGFAFLIGSFVLVWVLVGFLIWIWSIIDAATHDPMR